MKSSVAISSIVLLFQLVKPSVAQESDLSIYGYFDLELETSNKDAAGKRWTFDQHHFNVITIYRLDDRFRVFGEIEWEHGVQLEADGSSSSGSVALERAWLEYKHSDALKIKLGKFLSPFGIYNLRHDATPTYLPSFLPASVYGKRSSPLGNKQRIFAKFATGIQVLGTLIGDKWLGEYHFYLINGRGSDPGKNDDNSNKGFGGRLVVSPPVQGLRIGTSFYTDKNGMANHTRQTTLAFDAAFDFSNFQFKTEFVLPKLEEVDSTGAPNGNFRTGNGYYLQGAYSFFEKLTPFARYEFVDEDTDKSDDEQTYVTFGINFSVTSRIYLKSEIQFLRFREPSSKDHELFVSSIAVAF